MAFEDTINRLFHDWNYSHPAILWSLCRSLKPEVCMDLGSYRGLSAAWMARACQENNKGLVYCIDNFSLTDHTARYGNAKEHFWSNLRDCGVDGFIRLIEGDLFEVEWPEKVDFAYIDSWHSYTAAKHDFEKAAERGAKCICFDDTTQSAGPRLLMQEIRKLGTWDVMDLDRDCGLGICMRREPLRPITFSQEIPDLLPGMILSESTKKEQKAHFKAAHKITGVDYSPILGMIDEGRSE